MTQQLIWKIKTSHLSICLVLWQRSSTKIPGIKQFWNLSKTWISSLYQTFNNKKLESKTRQISWFETFKSSQNSVPDEICMKKFQAKIIWFLSFWKLERTHQLCILYEIGTMKKENESRTLNLIWDRKLGRITFPLRFGKDIEPKSIEWWAFREIRFCSFRRF